MSRTQNPSRGLRDLDLDAVEEAVELLRTAGYSVDSVDSVDYDSDVQGVRFQVDLSTPTRAKPMGDEENATVEDLTSVLLSAAAVNVEEVARIRDDLSPEESQRLAELVSSLRDLHELLSYSSELADVQPHTEVDA